MRILLIGTYQPLTKALKRGLEEEGFFVDAACGAGEVRAAALTGCYGAIVFDLSQPPDADLLLLEGWRRAGLQTRILVLTTPDSIAKRLHDLDRCADSWLSKPFAMAELLHCLQDQNL
jgi:DNA-binding response OmpR family regulator